MRFLEGSALSNRTRNDPGRQAAALSTEGSKRRHKLSFRPGSEKDKLSNVPGSTREARTVPRFRTPMPPLISLSCVLKLPS